MIEFTLATWFISWFIVGLISAMILWISDMRGKEFNENYFDSTAILISIVLIMLGYISLFMIFWLFTSEKKYFTKLIYKISNIGLKKNN